MSIEESVGEGSLVVLSVETDGGESEMEDIVELSVREVFEVMEELEVE